MPHSPPTVCVFGKGLQATPSAGDADEALLTPRGTPTVPHDVVVRSVPNRLHAVVQSVITTAAAAMKDTPTIHLPRPSCHSDRHRSLRCQSRLEGSRVVTGFFTKLVALTAALYGLQVASRPLYGRSDSKAMPCATVRLKASSMVAPSRPPVPP